MAILQVRDQSYMGGVARGVQMSDLEVMRYYNGITTMLNVAFWQAKGQERWSLTENVSIARKGLGERIDALAKLGMVAFIGYGGAPEFRPVSEAYVSI
jgi:hypothetical protein